MAAYRVAAVNEDHKPLSGVVVEAISLNSWPTVSANQTTGRNCTVQVTGLAGPHWFRPLVRRTSGQVGGRNYTGAIEIQVIALGEGVNVDYVVDSNGMGTHTALFGASGALEVAIATGGSRIIWVCASHTETVSATHALTELAINQAIVVRSFGGGPRPTFTCHADLGTTTLINHGGANSGAISLLRLQGLAFVRDSSDSAGRGSFITGTGGFKLPDIELVDLHWTDDMWAYIINLVPSNSGSMNRILIKDCKQFGDITAIIYTTINSGANGKFIVEHNYWQKMVSIAARVGVTSVEPGAGEGIIIESNVFDLITGFGWQLTFSSTTPFTFKDNYVTNFNAAVDFLDMGTSATNTVEDVIISDNYINCSAAGARAIDISPASGQAFNVAIMGNALRGPTSGDAINLSVTMNDSIVLNSYRNWDNNIVGAGAAGIGGDHGLLSGLGDDDHTQYVLLAGRASGQIVIGGTASGEDLTLQSTVHATRGEIIVVDKLRLHNDATFTIEISSSDPLITFNTDDSLRYDRADNVWHWSIGGTSVARMGRDISAANKNDLILDGDGTRSGLFAILGAVSSNAFQLFHPETSTHPVIAFTSTSTGGRISFGPGGDAAIDANIDRTVSPGAVALSVVDWVVAGDLFLQTDGAVAIASAESALRMFHWNDVAIILDADANSTTDAFRVMHNAKTIAGATDLFTVTEAGKAKIFGEVEIDGNLNHDGSGVGFYGTAPISQAVLATGTGATVDDVITALQNLGLVKQS